MPVIDTGDVLVDLVDNAIAILNLKKADWSIVQWFRTEQKHYRNLPAGVVQVMEAELETRGSQIARLNAQLSIVYYHGIVDERLLQEAVAQRTYDIAVWMATHRTLNGFCFDVQLDGPFGQIIRPQPDLGNYVAGGTVTVRCYKDDINLTDVS